MNFDTSEGGKMIAYAFLKILFLLQVLPVEAGEYCKYSYSSYYSSYSTIYCANGCCGGTYSDYSDVCCAGLEGGVIAGIVLGSLAALGILISLIACCCVAANNSSRRTGAVIQPANTGMQAFVVNSTAFSQGQSMIPGPQAAVGYVYPFGVQPPPYSHHQNVSHGSSNPGNAPPPPQY